MPKFMLILRSDITADYSTLTPEDFGEILAGYQAWGERMGERLGRWRCGRRGAAGESVGAAGSERALRAAHSAHACA